MHKTAAPWEELREKYEAGGYTYMQLAKEYGVSVQSVGRHARKEKWVSGCRNERRRRAESRDCLLEMTWALMRGAKRAAEEAEKGEACTKELKELAGILQTLAGLEKELGGGTAAQTVQVLLGEGVPHAVCVRKLPGVHTDGAGAVVQHHGTGGRGHGTGGPRGG